MKERQDFTLSRRTSDFRKAHAVDISGSGDRTVVLVQPDGDPVVPVAIGHFLAQRWPQARLDIIESVGRLPHLTSPQKVIEVLERSLAPAR